MKRRIIVGICGASGVIYGVRCLKLLRDAGLETHLVISPSGRLNIEIETPFSVAQVESMADFAYEYEDVSAPIASGSFLTQGMIVAPCTIKSLSAIANCYSDNLLVRAADVVLKERRKLCLLVRETPLHKGHLRLMGMAADLGALILPPMPSFYHLPKTIEEIIDQTVGKVFDYFEIEHELFKRWNGAQRASDRQ
ncbi:MAG: UbiX family flavin prenyltransferase [Syntrophobacteraceae bacterium]